MAVRTIRSSVTFAFPFKLRDFEHPEPAGTYLVDIDEDDGEGGGQSIRRRVATLLYLHNGASIRLRAVDPQDLEAALARDSRRGPAPDAT